MADIRIYNKNNTVYLFGEAYSAGDLTASNPTGNKVTIIRDSDSKVLVKAVPYDRIKDKDNNNWGASAAAAVTALNNYLGGDNPDEILTKSNKLTDLTGVTGADFLASKPGYGVFSGAVDGSLQTSDNFILHNSGVTVSGDLFFAGSGGALKTSSVGSITLAPTGGNLNLNPTQQFSQGGDISFYNGEYTFPTTDGSSGQVLGTNGQGTLSFVNQGGGSAVSLSYARLSMGSDVLEGGASQQDFNSSTPQKVKFNTQDDTEGTGLSISTANNRITITNGGYYRLTANIFWSAGTNRIGPTMSFYVNGSEIARKSMG